MSCVKRKRQVGNEQMSRTAVLASVQQLWKHLGLKDGFVEKKLVLSGDPDKVVQSSFRVGQLAQASTALVGLAASVFHGRRKSAGDAEDDRLGERLLENAPEVKVDARHAVLCFASEAYNLVDGELPRDIWDDLAGLYATKDGHVRIHTNFPHHRQAALYKTTTEGGSWEVRVSLAGVGQWLRDMGQLGAEDAFKGETMPARQAPMVEEVSNLSRNYVVRNPAGKSPRTLTALKSAICLDNVPDIVAEVPGSLKCDSIKWL
ncbi:hypothetical protein FRC19_005113 [Serendipita sp. 401]|nr:hypothetical protein FRC19_005113 [Serendipita sp. 401]